MQLSSTIVFHKNSLRAIQYQTTCLEKQVLPLCHINKREWLLILLKQTDNSAVWHASKHTNRRLKSLVC